MTDTVKKPLTSDEKQEATAAPSSPRPAYGEPTTGTPSDDAVNSAEKDPTVRVSKDSSLRKLIGFVIKKIENHETVTI